MLDSADGAAPTAASALDEGVRAAASAWRRDAFTTYSADARPRGLERVRFIEDVAHAVLARNAPCVPPPPGHTAAAPTPRRHPRPPRRYRICLHVDDFWLGADEDTAPQAAAAEEAVRRPSSLSPISSLTRCTREGRRSCVLCSPSAAPARRRARWPSPPCGAACCGPRRQPRQRGLRSAFYEDRRLWVRRAQPLGILPPPSSRASAPMHFRRSCRAVVCARPDALCVPRRHRPPPRGARRARAGVFPRVTLRLPDPHPPESGPNAPPARSLPVAGGRGGSRRPGGAPQCEATGRGRCRGRTRRRRRGPGVCGHRGRLGPVLGTPGCCHHATRAAA